MTQYNCKSRFFNVYFFTYNLFIQNFTALKLARNYFEFSTISIDFIYLKILKRDQSFMELPKNCYLTVLQNQIFFKL